MKKALPILMMACVGCFSMGKKIDQAAVGKIKEGQTTKAEVVKLLGNPDNVTRDSWNGEGWSYCFVRAASSPGNFVPVVGAFAGGGNSQTEFLTLTFDDKGVVRSLWSSAGGTTFNYGLATEGRPDDLQEPRAGKEGADAPEPASLSGPGD